jgi:hypothetical protein
MHTRTYTVRSFYEQNGQMRLRGAILDEKPERLFFPEDDEPLAIHEMVVDLFLDIPNLRIADVDVVMEVTPHLVCTSIEGSYDQLIGLSIGRGFTRRLTERFGGVNGCTHIGALLRAMAPVAVQSMWSIHHLDPENSPVNPVADDEESRREAMVFNLNSCHVWDENTALAQTALRGESIGIPVWAERRLEKLDRPAQDWSGF